MSDDSAASYGSDAEASFHAAVTESSMQSLQNSPHSTNLKYLPHVAGSIPERPSPETLVFDVLAPHSVQGSRDTISDQREVSNTSDEIRSDVGDITPETHVSNSLAPHSVQESTDTGSINVAGGREVGQFEEPSVSNTSDLKEDDAIREPYTGSLHDSYTSLEPTVNRDAVLLLVEEHMYDRRDKIRHEVEQDRRTKLEEPNKYDIMFLYDDADKEAALADRDKMQEGCEERNIEELRVCSQHTFIAEATGESQSSYIEKLLLRSRLLLVYMTPNLVESSQLRNWIDECAELKTSGGAYPDIWPLHTEHFRQRSYTSSFSSLNNMGIYTGDMEQDEGPFWKNIRRLKEGSLKKDREEAAAVEAAMEQEIEGETAQRYDEEFQTLERKEMKKQMMRSSFLSDHVMEYDSNRQSELYAGGQSWQQPGPGSQRSEVSAPQQPPQSDVEKQVPQPSTDQQLSGQLPVYQQSSGQAPTAHHLPRHQSPENPQLTGVHGQQVLDVENGVAEQENPQSASLSEPRPGPSQTPVTRTPEEPYTPENPDSTVIAAEGPLPSSPEGDPSQNSPSAQILLDNRNTGSLPSYSSGPGEDSLPPSLPSMLGNEIPLSFVPPSIAPSVLPSVELPPASVAPQPQTIQPHEADTTDSRGGRGSLSSRRTVDLAAGDSESQESESQESESQESEMQESTRVVEQAASGSLIGPPSEITPKSPMLRSGMVGNGAQESVRVVEQMPSGSLVEPPVSLAEPPVSLVEPPVSLAEPPGSLAEPPVSLAEPPVSLAEPPVSLAEPPVSLAEPPRSLAEPPSNKTPESLMSRSDAAGSGAPVSNIVPVADDGGDEGGTGQIRTAFADMVMDGAVYVSKWLYR